MGLATVGYALAPARGRRSGPSLELSERSTYSCGSVPPDAYGRHAWELRNAGTQPLRIRTRFTSGHSGFSLWQGQYHVVEPGARITVHLTWVSPSLDSVAFSSYATLWTNDYDRPEIRITVVGKTAPARTSSD